MIARRTFLAVVATAPIAAPEAAVGAKPKPKFAGWAVSCYTDPTVDRINRRIWGIVETYSPPAFGVREYLTHIARRGGSITKDFKVYEVNGWIEYSFRTVEGTSCSGSVKIPVDPPNA